MHPVNASYISEDGLVSYDAYGRRLDSLGNVAYGADGYLEYMDATAMPVEPSWYDLPQQQQSAPAYAPVAPVPAARGAGGTPSAAPRTYLMPPPTWKPQPPPSGLGAPMTRYDPLSSARMSMGEPLRPPYYGVYQSAASQPDGNTQANWPPIPWQMQGSGVPPASPNYTPIPRSSRLPYRFADGQTWPEYWR